MDWNDPEEREAERIRLQREEDTPPVEDMPKVFDPDDPFNLWELRTGLYSKLLEWCDWTDDPETDAREIMGIIQLHLKEYGGK